MRAAFPVLLLCLVAISACSTQRAGPPPVASEAHDPAIVPLTLEQEWEIAGVRRGT